MFYWRYINVFGRVSALFFWLFSALFRCYIGVVLALYWCGIGDVVFFAVLGAASDLLVL